VLALSIKKNEEKEGKERRKKNYLLALSGLEDIQGGCFPD
jgi:hypothetical protein